MPEYIEREAATDAVKKERDYIGKFSYEEERAFMVGFHQAITFALSDISSIPAADVRPVVTCGECEFWNRERISCEGLARCNTGEGEIQYRNRNDFCSRGKKREES